MTLLPETAARSEVPPDAELIAELAAHSHKIITSHQHAGGAYPASPTFSAYAGYAWLRDGSFTAEGISRYGDVDSASRFHDWAAGVLEARADDVAALVAARSRGQAIPTERMLPTRFRLDGRAGEAPWWDFQTDGYGTWLWAVITHAERHRLDLDRWRRGIEVCTSYLGAFWDLPCYDWWEEHVEHRHVSTLGAIFGGLTAVAAAEALDPAVRAAAAQVASAIRTLVLRDGVRDGHLTKWLGSLVVDGSLASCIVPFGLLAVDDERAVATLDRVEADLDVGGGVHRYAADVFYGGGQWPLLSALVGWNCAVAGDPQMANVYLRWVAAQVTPDHELPEQVAHHLLAPGYRAEWLERWGPVATPLLWSHGMFLIVADELGLARRPAGPDS